MRVARSGPPSPQPRINPGQEHGADAQGAGEHGLHAAGVAKGDFAIALAGGLNHQLTDGVAADGLPPAFSRRLEFLHF